MSETVAAPAAAPASAAALLAEAPPSASPPPAAAPSAAPPAEAPVSWLAGIADPDLKGYLENKGWKDPADLANGYRNLEKLVGVDKVPMPKGPEDKEGWARAYDAMGRPKDAGDYQLPVPEGGNADFATAAAGKFHELGLSTAQARGAAAWYNEAQAAQMKEVVAQVNQKSAGELAALKGEWGADYDKNLSLGKRTVQEFGVTPDQIAAIEGAMGPGAMLKMFSKMGHGLMEHNFEGGRDNTGFGANTPDAAKSRIAELRRDRDFSAKYIAGDAASKAEMARLHQIAYPEQP